MKKILVLDNYDSFTYNLVHYIENIVGYKIDVFRNDKISLDDIEQYDKILLSPGPGLPNEAGIMMDLIKRYAPSKSILGVCLGHEGIAEVFGANLFNLNKVFHGVSTTIKRTDSIDPVFKDIPLEFKGGRYHSWAVETANLPSCLQITAIDADGIIMAISHKEYDVHGVQFHPESVLTDHGMKMIENWINI